MTTIQFIRDTPEGRVYATSDIKDAFDFCVIAGANFMIGTEAYEQHLKGNYYVILK